MCRNGFKKQVTPVQSQKIMVKMQFVAKGLLQAENCKAENCGTPKAWKQAQIAACFMRESFSCKSQKWSLPRCLVEF